VLSNGTITHGRRRRFRRCLNFSKKLSTTEITEGRIPHFVAPGREQEESARGAKERMPEVARCFDRDAAASVGYVGVAIGRESRVSVYQWVWLRSRRHSFLGPRTSILVPCSQLMGFASLGACSRQHSTSCGRFGLPAPTRHSHVLVHRPCSRLPILRCRRRRCG
jgi:hypothetical protein